MGQGVYFVNGRVCVCVVVLMWVLLIRCVVERATAVRLTCTNIYLVSQQPHGHMSTFNIYIFNEKWIDGRVHIAKHTWQALRTSLIKCDRDAELLLISSNNASANDHHLTHFSVPTVQHHIFQAASHLSRQTTSIFGQRTFVFITITVQKQKKQYGSFSHIHYWSHTSLIRYLVFVPVPSRLTLQCINNHKVTGLRGGWRKYNTLLQELTQRHKFLGDENADCRRSVFLCLSTDENMQYWNEWFRRIRDRCSRHEWQISTATNK